MNFSMIKRATDIHIMTGTDRTIDYFVKPNVFGKNSTPLSKIGENLIFEKNLTLYLGSYEEKEKISNIPASFFHKFARRSKYLSRILRLLPSAATTLDNKLYFGLLGKIICYDLNNKIFLEPFSLNRGRSPLNISSIYSIDGFDDGLLFGEYFSNPSKGQVNIYSLKKTKNNNQWEIIYTFPEGKINHVHNIIPDSIRGAVWILAGDFDNAASIWKTEDNFKSVNLICSGEQKYRSCVAFSTEQGIVYATDSQFNENTIRLLYYEDGKYRNRPIGKINGPSIYGTEIQDFWVFSTSTEPAFSNSCSRLSKYLSRRPGPGITHNRSEIIACRKSDNRLFRVWCANKDFIPFTLGQFGNIRFLTTEAIGNRLYFQSIANNTNDLDISYFDLDHLTEVH